MSRAPTQSNTVYNPAFAELNPGEIYTSQVPLQLSIMLLAKQWADCRSKDPNTKVGAAVYDSESGGIFLGYNGFPSGFPDLKAVWDNRDATKAHNKYEYVVHAEVNAIRKAAQLMGNLGGCVLYVTHFPCHRCMKDAIIPSGLRRVIYADSYPHDDYSVILAQGCGVDMRQLQEQVC